MADGADNVIELNNITRLDIPPERVLRKAADADLESAIVIGWEKGGHGGFYFASSIAAGPETLWLLALAQKKLLEIGDPEVE